MKNIKRGVIILGNRVCIEQINKLIIIDIF